MAEDIIMIIEDNTSFNTSIIDKSIIKFNDISLNNLKQKIPPRLRFFLCCNENSNVRDYIMKNINYLKHEDFIIGENVLSFVFLEKYFEYYRIGPNVYLFTSDTEKYKTKIDDIKNLFNLLNFN